MNSPPDPGSPTDSSSTSGTPSQEEATHGSIQPDVQIQLPSGPGFSKSPIRLPPLQEPPNAATLPAGPVALRHLRGIPSYADAVMLQGLLWKRVSRRKHLGKKRMNWLTLTSSSF